MKQNYPNLFKLGNLGGKRIKNRIVMSAMGDNMANADGSVSQHSIAYYSARAKGGVGAIVTGVVCVDFPRKTIASQYIMDDPKYISGWSRLARAVHRYDTLLIPQLGYVGGGGDPVVMNGELPLQVSDPDPNAKQLPGSTTDSEYDSAVNEAITITVEQLKKAEQKFIDAAIYMQMAGCDGIELDCTAYLLGELNSPVVNFRTDEYGGSVQNRLRLTVDIVEGIRKACGKDFIIGVRMPVHKWDADGLTDETSIEIARTLESISCDYLDAFNGMPPSVSALMESQYFKQGDRVDQAELLKSVVDIPVMAVGKLRDPDFCDNILSENKADFVKLGRALLCDPEWPNKAKEGKNDEILRCISCLEACYGNLALSQPIECVINPVAGNEYRLDNLEDAANSRRIVIIGGGLAGMQAAITAADRGHDVVIFEKDNKLGGQLKIAGKAPFKEDISSILPWFELQVKKRDIEVRLNNIATIEKILELKPDLVLVASGAIPAFPSVNGLEHAQEAWKVLDGTIDIPENKNVAVLGGGTIGCEIAQLLSEKNNKVTVFEMTNVLARGLEEAHKVDLLSYFEQHNIETILNAKVIDISGDLCITYEHENNETKCNYDFAVIAMGQKSVCDLEMLNQLDEAGIMYQIIGDAKEVKNFEHATKTAFAAAINA